MPCELTDVELAEFSAGDLASERVAEIEQHVVACTECQRRLAALRKADGVLRALPRMAPSARSILGTRRLLADELRDGNEPEIMTLDDVAAFLRISLDELDDIAGELPAFELAGRVRVRRARLVEWIEQREIRYRMQNTESSLARIAAAPFGKGVA